MDELQRIERQYGSVAEYNRCMQEDDEYRSERKYQRWLQYKENQQKVDELISQGHRPLFEAFCGHQECFDCTNRTKTYSRDEEDDIGLFFCMNTDCETYEEILKE